MKSLIYQKLAYEVQQICNEQKKKGITSETEIFFNSVMEVVPVCLDTYRKMLKEDLSDLPKLAKEYRDRELEAYLEQLEKKSRKKQK